jgi:two-component sensor histidine kinase
MGVGEAAVTSLALVFHELATNSLKYGALSVPNGTLDITTASKGSQLQLIWIERGGPAMKAPPEASGFGSKLVQRSVFKQLGGTINYDWRTEGLIATLLLDRDKLAA